MGRYTGPSCRLCRREGMKLFLKGTKCTTPKCPIEKRNFAPGQHGQVHPGQRGDLSAEQGDLGGGIGEDDFRYPGPRPQTKEAGLVMCADVTEAAIRSLDDPSPEEIRQMVQKLTTRIYMEGQLDESGLTFNDLNFIEKTFTKMLLSIHHHRISYPDAPFSGKRQDRIDDTKRPSNRRSVASD